MPGAKLQANNPANDPDLKPVKGHSKFKPTMSLYKTHRYGMIEPHFALEVVPDDKSVSYRSGSDIDTQNLKAPLMTPVKMNKDTFFVPLRAILPHNADLLVTNPLTGDDVVPENVNCCIDGYYEFNSFITSLNARLYRSLKGNPSATQTQTYTSVNAFHAHLLHLACILYQVGSPLLSYGSLAQSLGYNFAALYRGFYKAGSNVTYMNFDETLDVIFSYLKSSVTSFNCLLMTPTINSSGSISYDSKSVSVGMSYSRNSLSNSSADLTFRSFLELLEQGAYPVKIEYCWVDSSNTNIAFPASDYGVDFTNASAFTTWNVNFFQAPTGLKRYHNLSRLVAYQLACASFYTDDAVDYVYTSKLWHQNMNSIACKVMGSSNWSNESRYMMNGVSMEYDSVSGHILSWMLNYVGTYTISQLMPDASGTDFASSKSEVSGYSSKSKYILAIEYYLNIFGYQRSLRYRDYFVGSRTAPLAVGNVTVAVNNSTVDVVDVTKNIQMQRFLNQVNRIGRRIKEYSAGIFGVAPRSETDEPIFLSHVSVQIGAEETANTGAAQLTDAQTTTSKLRKDTSAFIFSSDFNEYGVVIGVTTFDAVRPLPDAADRQLFHIDRFDMFNPFMQHVGDQDVPSYEISPGTFDPFGYKLRYSEYKQRTDRVAGAFAGESYLPGFAFVTDVNDLGNPLATYPGLPHISPDFIRIKPHEFDKFFNILPYDSLAGYFHFIIRHDNEVDALRPMEAAPSIL